MLRFLKAVALLNIVLAAIAVCIAVAMYVSVYASEDASNTSKVNDRPIKVMAIDTGVDYNNKKLSRYIPSRYKNIDYMDYHNHGTHVAGIILRDACSEVEFIPCKFFDSLNSGDENQHHMTECIQKALILKVTLVNISAGGDEYLQDEYSAMKALTANGAFVVASVGNEQHNIDKTPFYPASYDLEHIIKVGSLDEDGKRSSYSSWGKDVLFEIGSNVLSTLPYDNEGRISGASQATAKVTNNIILNLCRDRHR
jgi:subtilisin family serine protease